ncbi:MAG: argininosuccinate synthase [Lentisphaerae bacterium]|nr:argininosuccinate synthase [Lentisphaerota bacterium]
MTFQELKNKKVGLCVSGGLDSQTLARKLTELGIDLVCFTADLGQPDEADIRSIRKRMARCGARTVIVDLKRVFAEACFEVIKAQARYDGGYWNTTGIARAITVQGLIPEMKRRGCTVLAHGATGRGNDQVRFERYANVLAPELQVYAPWRDPELLREFPGRRQMADYLRRCGLTAAALSRKRYSTDANLAGLSHEAADLESLQTPCTIVKPTMGVWPHQAPNRVERFTVHFKQGRATVINGRKVQNGIGLKHALENRIIGTKSRGVYEAPGMELLGRSLEFIYQATFDRRALLLFEQLSNLVANQIYDGRYFDPATRAALAAINILAGPATGAVQAGLYKGNIYFQKLWNCPASLYHPADSSMEASRGLNPVSAQGFVEVQSVEARSLARAGQIGK